MEYEKDTDTVIANKTSNKKTNCETSHNTLEMTTISNITTTTAGICGKNESTSANIKAKTQHLQNHQFRHPQHFVGHRKTSNSSHTMDAGIMCNRKGKLWNKRQSKCKLYGVSDVNVQKNNSASSSISANTNASVIKSNNHESKDNMDTPLSSSLTQCTKNLQSTHKTSDSQKYLKRCNCKKTDYTANANSLSSSSSAAVTAAVASSSSSSSSLSSITATSVKQSVKFDERIIPLPLMKQQTSKKVLSHRGIHNCLKNNCCTDNNKVVVVDHVNGVCCRICYCCSNTNTKEKSDLTLSNTISNNSVASNSSNTTNYCCLRSKFFLADKRSRNGNFIPPTKFLLGGNISDPLNLNSLQNEASAGSLNSTPGTTPRQSPITTPPKVEVLIPPNIHDPLHLLDPVDSMEYEKQLTSPIKRDFKLTRLKLDSLRNFSKSCKHRHRKNRKVKRRCSVDPLKSLNNSMDNNHAEKLNSNPTAMNSYMAAHQMNIEKNSTDPQMVEKQNDGNNSINNHIIIDNNSTEEALRLTDQKIPTNNMEDDLAKKIEISNTNINSESIPTKTNPITSGRKRKISENNGYKAKKYRMDSMDKIVSPVIPQPGAWMRPLRTATGCRKVTAKSTLIQKNENTKTIKLNDSNKTNTNNVNEGTASPNTVNKVELKQNSSLPTSSSNSKTINNKSSQQDTNGNLKRNRYKMPSENKITNTKNCNKYQYGNCDRYSSVKHFNEFTDVRLQIFQHFPELFANKDILDIGCNVGNLTIFIGRKLAPKSILGIDIDKKLIDQARLNIGKYVSIPPHNIQSHQAIAEEIPPDISNKTEQGKSRRALKKRNAKKKHSSNLYPAIDGHLHYHHHHHHHYFKNKLTTNCGDFFPFSFPLTFGNIVSLCNSNQQHIGQGSPASISKGTPVHSASINNNNTIGTPVKTSNTAKSSNSEFPNNVFFRKCNYVLKDESLMANDLQQYDLILCLSVTKWIHLNFGDAGLKLAFKRMFNQLRPGGKLILEAHNWNSYKKNKNLTEKIHKNYTNIELLPNKFHEYLLSTEVGFSHSYTLGLPTRHTNRNLSRPIQLYAKGDFTPNHVRWSDAYYPQTPFEAYRGIYATLPPLQSTMGMQQSSYPARSSVRSQNFETPQYSTSYNLRQTPMYQSSGSSYYNPMESDTYLPSYDMEYLNHMYVFASPLYQTVWSPPNSLQNCSTSAVTVSQTAGFGGTPEATDLDIDGGVAENSTGTAHRHVYPPTDDNFTQNAIGFSAFKSIREVETDDSNPALNQCLQPSHIYATNSNNSGGIGTVTSNTPEAILNEDEADEATAISSNSNC